MFSEEKRYQVFVSSTYLDLVEERREVMQALLELDCIPAGMELFPASDETQWELIERVIDQSDYYVLIIGGRYGSVDKEGLSYTEREYRYALQQEIPIISFLHSEPQELPAKHSEVDADKKRSLDNFRELAQQKLCKYWSNADELGSKVSRSLVMQIKRNPRIGWIRGDVTTDKKAAIQIIALNAQIESLEAKLERARTTAPEGASLLASGDDTFTANCSLETRAGEYGEYEYFTWESVNVQPTWNQIFAAISPLLINEAKEHQLRDKFENLLFNQTVAKLVKDGEDLAGHRRTNFIAPSDSFSTVIVQLRALGLIQISEKNRSVKDTASYWTLTDYGNDVMNRLRAIRKKPESQSTGVGTLQPE